MSTALRSASAGTPLFQSDTKYESGTGWPSFWSPISPHNVRVRRRPRTGCDARKQRLNSAAMDFEKKK